MNQFMDRLSSQDPNSSLFLETLNRRKSSIAIPNTQRVIEDLEVKKRIVQPHTHVKAKEADKSTLKIVNGYHTIGKGEDGDTTNEDAFFLTERGFGVADGVSGWNDFGFSSQAFSNALMVGYTSCPMIAMPLF